MPYHDFTEMPIWIKAMNIAVQIFELTSNLPRTEDYGLTSQIRRSAESISANIAEGLEGQSTKDFVSKLSIALKEAVESRYWIDLLKETEYLTEEQYNIINNDITELIKMLTRIIKTTKEKMIN